MSKYEDNGANVNRIYISHAACIECDFLATYQVAMAVEV